MQQILVCHLLQNIESIALSLLCNIVTHLIPTLYKKEEKKYLYKN